MNNRNLNEEAMIKEEKFKKKLAIYHVRREIMETLERSKLFTLEIFVKKNKLKPKLEKENYDGLFLRII
jgi:hypothetical protein